MRHSTATLYLAGPTYANEIAANLTRRGIMGFTILAGYGVWQGKSEPAFAVTIIGETDYPAHIVKVTHVHDGRIETVLMPATENAFEGRIRDLAENLAAD